MIRHHSARSPLTVGVIGLGVGEQHARTLAATSGVYLSWLCDLDLSRAETLAATLGKGRVAPSLDAVLADAMVDLVVLASYDDQHAQQVLAAFAAGKHVFCEKPLCRTLDEVRAIERARGERHLQCNLILRAAPLYRWLREAIAAGELGEVYAIDGDYLYGRLHKITEGWRSGVDDYSVIQGGGVHLVDLMLWLTGQRPERVTAAGNRIVTRESAFRYPDFVAATYEFPSGLVGRITANFGCVHKHQHVLRVFGTKATFIHDDAGARLHLQRDPGGPPRAPATAATRAPGTAATRAPGTAATRAINHAPVAANKGDLLPGFVQAISAGIDPEPAARHEYDVIAACIAADRALASRNPQPIEYP